MRDSNGMHRESFTFTRTVLNGIEMVRGLYIREALRKTTMARITPIDVIKGISGKYGDGSQPQLSFYLIMCRPGQVESCLYADRFIPICRRGLANM